MHACVLVALTVVIAGCDGRASEAHLSGVSPSVPDAATGSATSVSTQQPSPSQRQSISPADAAKAVAVTAYLRMWQDFATAGHTSDWQSPVLARHANAYALQVMQKSLYTDHQHGVVTKGAPVDHPRVKSVRPATNPTVVVIADSGDSSQWRKYDAKTDQPAPGSPGGRQAITAEVRQQSDGSWKVDEFAVEGVGSC
jgi:hypothetical protein